MPGSARLPHAPPAAKLLAALSLLKNKLKNSDQARLQLPVDRAGILYIRLSAYRLVAEMNFTFSKRLLSF